MNNLPKTPIEHRYLIELCLKHLTPFFWQGPGLLLIARVGLPAIFDDLQEKGIPVLGLEGFELEGDAIRPRLDLIYVAGLKTGNDSGLDTIATWVGDVWVDVTIGELPSHSTVRS